MKIDSMLSSIAAYWCEKEEAWIATVTSDMTDFPYRKYKIRACDEFVEPMALMEMHGLDSMKVFGNPEGWFIEDIT